MGKVVLRSPEKQACVCLSLTPVAACGPRVIARGDLLVLLPYPPPLSLSQCAGTPCVHAHVTRTRSCTHMALTSPPPTHLFSLSSLRSRKRSAAGIGNGVEAVGRLAQLNARGRLFN
jgi:hypothetical protein